MSLEQTTTKIVEIISAVDMVYIIHPTERESIERVLGIIATDFGKLEEDEKVEVEQDDVDAMHSVLNFCKRMVLEEPITERLSDLVTGICLLVHNWNVNLGEDGTIHKDVKFLTSAMKQHFTIVQAVEILKNILGRINNINHGHDNINSISAHYLQALDKIHEVDKDECKEDSCI